MRAARLLLHPADRRCRSGQTARPCLLARCLPAWGAALVLLTGAAIAQVEADKFDKRQAERMSKFAKRAFDKGFPRQARLIWLQAIKLYDPDDPIAHKGLGHVKLGTSWNPDPNFTYPRTDSGTGKDGAALFKAYEKLKKDLASAHRTEAAKWERAGRGDKTQHHYKLVLRWVKNDKKAQAALSHREVGGLTGTNLEKTLYDNSKKIEAAVIEQTGIDYASEKVEGSTHPILERANVEYITLKSEHFTVRGDPEEEENLRQALAWAERAVHVVRAAFPRETFKTGPAQWQTDWAYFLAKDTYKQILNANAERVANLKWRLEHSTTCYIGGSQGPGLRLGATINQKGLFDACVRNVARAQAQFASPALVEGIGHTFVGMVFNNNRLFSVDLEKQQRITASEEDREYMSPDFDVWKDLNLEMAWKRTGGVPAMDLPFLETAKFSNPQRIKAWSFCDYMMRRDPVLLRDLDRLGAGMKSANKRQPLELDKKFGEDHEVSVADLDKEWEDFWTGATPVLKAIQNNTPPLAAVSKGVEKWLTAYNEARRKIRSTTVTWSSNLSTRCHDHAVYLKNNKRERGPAKEQRQDPELGGTHLGSMFAEMAIVCTNAKVNKADDLFESWMHVPGYRDALVSNMIRSVGIYSLGNILVMNVVSSLGVPDEKKDRVFKPYPVDKSIAIPRQVSVAELGPELVALLQKHGKAGTKVVGYPITLHFGVNLQGDPKSYQCAVTDPKGVQVAGAILRDGGNNRRTTAPGMVTFYPFEPLQRGEHKVVWTYTRADGPQAVSSTFTTK